MTISCAKPSLDIIIVNWNSGEQLHDCLTSIADACNDEFILARVCVVDNASEDDSLKNIESYKLPIQIVRNNANRGFAAACNQGAKESQADYLLFLNPDIRLYTDSLTRPLTFMQQPTASDAGIVGIQLIGDNGEIGRTCARFPTPGSFFSKMLGIDRIFPQHFPSHFMLEWDHKESREVDQVMGAFFLVKRLVFESLHGFDERFFVYLEDLDFSVRAHQAGWRSYYSAEVSAYHKGGGTSSQVKSTRLFYFLRSRIIYSYKHFSWGAATGLALGTLLLEPVTRLAWATARRSVKEAVETTKGYLKLWRSTPIILKEAWKQKRYENSGFKSL
jgi:hypothetical protein